MIRYLERDNIDEKKWDTCIQKSFNGNLYGYSWFLDVVAGEWAGLVEGDYERVFPLPFRKKYGIHYIYQPFFTQQLGLYSKSALNTEILSKFLDASLPQFQYIEINLNLHNKADEDRYKVLPQVNHELDLIHSYEKILNRYSDNLQRNLKKASKAGLSIMRNPKPDTIVKLFRDNRGKTIKHLKDNDYQRLLHVVYQSTYKRIADIRGVYDERNSLVAGAFFIRSHKKTIFLFSGLSDEGREKAAMPFLIDSYIRENAGRHLTFDFDGSNDPNLARFYKGFGSKEMIYQRVVIDSLPIYAKVGYRLLKSL